MLIQLVGCHRHPASHFASWFTLSLSLSLAACLSFLLHFSMQAGGLQLKSHHLIASGLCLSPPGSSDNIPLSYLHSLQRSIHLGSSLTNSSITLDDIRKRSDLSEAKVLILGQNTLLLYEVLCIICFVFLKILFVLVNGRYLSTSAEMGTQVWSHTHIDVTWNSSSKDTNLGLVGLCVIVITFDNNSFTQGLNKGIVKWLLCQNKGHWNNHILIGEPPEQLANV